MASISNVGYKKLEANHLERYVRTALERGELSPAVESQISYLAGMGVLSDRDHNLLRVLYDAIQDGCVRRV
jgi:DNA-binding TFAR19-related protein (PDSD5 family)